MKLKQVLLSVCCLVSFTTISAQQQVEVMIFRTEGDSTVAKKEKVKMEIIRSANDTTASGTAIAKPPVKAPKEYLLKSGDNSATFKYQDINGKTVSLADFEGKYVLIDVWATWCAPCKKEIPFLQALEKKMQGKNIVFASISCDQNKAAWEKMVKNEKLGGVQLHTGGDKTFMEAYEIDGIPRFILLDKKGKIIDPNMKNRPSDPTLSAYLNILEGISD
jgi:thiol-disulfide isomerase/thioredoxin